jgi:hypothetical protein
MATKTELFETEPISLPQKVEALEYALEKGDIGQAEHLIDEITWELEISPNTHYMIYKLPFEKMAKQVLNRAKQVIATNSI